MHPALQRQVAVLLAQFMRGTGEAWIGIAGIERLGIGQRFPPTMRLGGRLEPIAGVPPSRGFVWVQGTEPELWLDPDVDHRALYARFAEERLGVTNLPSSTVLNIDHVFPRTAGAKDGLSHVRMLAVPSASNQAAGRTVEKRMSQRAGVAPSRKQVRHATWVSIGKAVGFTGWEHLPDSTDPAANDAQVNALFDHLAAQGILPPAGALERKLTSATLTRHR
jgi:hypothetical protein